MPLESNYSVEIYNTPLDTLTPAQVSGLAASVSQGKVTLTWSPVVDNVPVVGETLQGTVDGTNKNFVTSYKPIRPGTYIVYLYHQVTNETLTADGTFTVYTAAHPFKDGSVQVFVNGTEQTSGFTIDNANGKITFFPALTSSDVVTANYIWVDQKTETTDYTIDLSTGTITFVNAPVLGDTPVIDYTAELTDLAFYYIYRASTSGGTLTKVGEVASTVTSQVTTFEDTTAPDGATVYYKVSAVDDDTNEGPKSTELSVKTVPSIPTGLKATRGDRLVNLTWNDMKAAGANPNLTNYKVYRATTSGGPYTEITTVTSNYYQDTNVVNNTTYYYVVTSVDANA